MISLNYFSYFSWWRESQYQSQILWNLLSDFRACWIWKCFRWPLTPDFCWCQKVGFLELHINTFDMSELLLGISRNNKKITEKCHKYFSYLHHFCFTKNINFPSDIWKQQKTWYQNVLQLLIVITASLMLFFLLRSMKILKNLKDIKT